MGLEQKLSHWALLGARAEVRGWDPGLRPWGVTGLWLKPAAGPFRGDICTHPGQGVTANNKSYISMYDYTGEILFWLKLSSLVLNVHHARKWSPSQRCFWGCLASFVLFVSQQWPLLPWKLVGVWPSAQMGGGCLFKSSLFSFIIIFFK